MPRKKVYDSNAERQEAYRERHGVVSFPKILERLSVAVRKAASAGVPLAVAACKNSDDPDDFALVPESAEPSTRAVTKVVTQLIDALERETYHSMLENRK